MTPSEKFEASVRQLVEAADMAGGLASPKAPIVAVIRLALERLDSERADLAAAEQHEREQREGEFSWGGP